MSEWWTYTLTDFLLFSPRTYYRLFELYNAAVWPLQIVTLALGLAILVLIRRRPVWTGPAIAALLAGCWLFVAWAYLLERYDTINWAARYFAVGFLAEAALLAWTGVIRDRLRFDPRGFAAGTGLAFLVYALAIHPLIAHQSGGSTSRCQCDRSAASRTPSVAMVVGSGARPKISACSHGRPVSGATSGWIARA